MSISPCTHRPPCPGCPRYGEGGLPERARDRLRALATVCSAPEPRFVSGAANAYRHRARLVVRGRAHSPKVGLFQAQSHRIVDVPRCPIHHPLINEVAAEVKACMRELAVAPYAEAPHRGCVRSLQLVVQRSRPEPRIQLTIVENAEQPEATAPLLDRLVERLGPRLQGLYWNGNASRTNTILGPRWRHWSGAEMIEERIGGKGPSIFFPPDAFGQSNLPLFDRIAERVFEWLAGAEGVAEFYAGSGGLGLNLLAAGASLHFNEVAPGGLRGLAAGLAALPEADRARAERSDGPAEAVAPGLLASQSFDAAIVDPPRRGLDAAVLEALCKHGPARIVAISCGLDAFEIEARALVERGGYAMSSLEGYDLFPHTEHVETLALFER